MTEPNEYDESPPAGVTTATEGSPETATAAGAAEADVEPPSDPVAELRESLRFAPGEWYVVHSYAGYENKVKANLETRISSLDMEDYIFQVEVPTREEVEVKNGKRQQVQDRKSTRLNSSHANISYAVFCLKK